MPVGEVPGIVDIDHSASVGSQPSSDSIQQAPLVSVRAYPESVEVTYNIEHVGQLNLIEVPLKDRQPPIGDLSGDSSGVGDRLIDDVNRNYGMAKESDGSRDDPTTTAEL